MFDRLDDLLIRYEELMEELNNPYVVEDQKKFRKLMKEQAEAAGCRISYSKISG